jgi:hypothetical protein
MCTSVVQLLRIQQTEIEQSWSECSEGNTLQDLQSMFVEDTMQENASLQCNGDPILIDEWVAEHGREFGRLG